MLLAFRAPFSSSSPFHGLLTCAAESGIETQAEKKLILSFYYLE